MNKIKIVSSILLIALTSHSFAQIKAKSSASGISAKASLGSNGMLFTQNNGQIVDIAQHLRPDILFKGDGGGADIYLRKTGISYVMSNMGEVTHELEEQVEDLVKAGKITREQVQAKKRELEEKQMLKIHRIDVDFVNCNANATIQTAEQAEGYSNYYYAHSPKGITHVLSYNEIIQKNIYPNIDIKYYGGKEKGLKYDIIVNPGADPSQLKLKYSGAEELKIKDENSSTGLSTRLIIKTSVGQLGEYMPKVYQNINGKIVDSF
jgi:hypothetical protein